MKFHNTSPSATLKVIATLCLLSCYTPNHFVHGKKPKFRTKNTSTMIAAEGGNEIQWPCDRCDPECSASKYAGPGKIPGVGVLYSVSGSLKWAKKAFVPVVRYLSQIGVPDPATRARTNSYKFALVMEEYICREMPPDILSFFDVLITFSKVPGDHPNPKHPIENDGDRRRRLAYRPGAPLMGEGTLKDRTNLDLRHFVKAFKVQAMNTAPFETTVYMDIDLIPCSPDSVNDLIGLYGTEVDMSLHPDRLWYYDIPKDEDRHYLGNSHNSALVVMNLKSPVVFDLLQTYHNIYYSEKDHHHTVLDQPSLGAAMTEINRKGGFTHNDITDDVFCKEWKWKRAQGDARKGPSSCATGCMFMHKVEEARLAPHEKLLGKGASKTTIDAAETQNDNYVEKPLPNKYPPAVFLNSLTARKQKIAKATCAGEVMAEDSFRRAMSIGKAPKIMIMALSPYESAVALFFKCRDKTNTGLVLRDHYSFTHGATGLGIHFESWLDTMLTPENNSLKMRASGRSTMCQSLWNVQSRMLTCDDRPEVMNGINSAPSLEPDWEKVKVAAKRLDFIGLQDRHLESVCLIRYTNKGCDAIRTGCNCVASAEQVHSIRGLRTNHDSLNIASLHPHISRKIDIMTRIDQQYYELAKTLFEEKLIEVHQKCGIRISCQ